jgi:pyridoxal phosphate enzyme (YggS family)
VSMTEAIADIRRRIADAACSVGRDPEEITLVAATKTQSADTVRTAIAAGITVCGENRVQEMTEKLDCFAYDHASLHFIGHLQTNKVKFVVGRVDCIESIGSMHLVQAVNEYAARLGRIQDILLQINIGREPQKSGVFPEDVPALVQMATQAEHLRLRGFMCVPPAARTPGENREFFGAVRQLFIDTKDKISDNDRLGMTQLSMGMSGDFEDAVREGATLVRVGSALFGPRNTI